MDRRQKKTRAAIFSAFGRLLKKKRYSGITVQEILDEADISRSTFYAHFETKDNLLHAICEELFGHVLTSAADHHMNGGHFSGSAPESMFYHLFQHFAENENNIMGLLCSENNDLFLRFFKDSLNELVRSQLSDREMSSGLSQLPEGFLAHHISSSFVETVLWWFRDGLKQTPEEIYRCFMAVMGPLLQPEEAMKEGELPG